MKRLGLIGGVSPESTVIYYRLLNSAVGEKLGGVHSAPLIVWSLDFGDVEAAYRRADWRDYAAQIAAAAKGLERAGAEGFLICSNTSHLAAAEAAAAVGIPLVHLMDALADQLTALGARRPLLLGTRFVMEGDFYRRELARCAAVESLVPHEAARREVERIIFDELARGKVLETSREALKGMIAEAAKSGADAVILGCTELSMILSDRDAPFPVCDSTAIHAAAGAAFILKD